MIQGQPDRSAAFTRSALDQRHTLACAKSDPRYAPIGAPSQQCTIVPARRENRDLLAHNLRKTRNR